MAFITDNQHFTIIVRVKPEQAEVQLVMENHGTVLILVPNSRQAFIIMPLILKMERKNKRAK